MIWTGDLSFKPLGEVKIGDEVIGFKSNTGIVGFKPEDRNKLCKSLVIDISVRNISNIIKITLESGRTIRCTPDHKWLVSNHKTTPWFYGEIKENMFMARIIDPTPPITQSQERDAGWLAGMYDGEGCDRGIAQCPIYNPEIYSKISEVSERLGISLTQTNKGYYITGGRQGYVNFLNIVRPIKRGLEKTILSNALINPRDRVIKIEKDGEGPTICLSTTTGNYIVWGYASKNTAAHSGVTIGEILHDWTEKKFSAFNLAFLRRQIVESMESRKLAIISGIYANTNLDDGKGTRQKMIQDMEENFREAIAELYDPTPEVDLKENPFFEAMNVPGADIDWEKYSEENPPTPPISDLHEDLDIDQM